MYNLPVILSSSIGQTLQSFPPDITQVILFGSSILILPGAKKYVNVKLWLVTSCMIL